MISPIEVYLFMQVSNLAFGLLFIGVGVGVVGVVQSIAIEAEYGSKDKCFKKPKRNLKIAAGIILFVSLIPSRETIAAMYILPKLTSPEFVEPATAEAKELYDLLKKALKEKGGDK
jgi:hypothetical protein